MVSAPSVSLARRSSQVAFAVFFCVTCAGIIFGFAGSYFIVHFLWTSNFNINVALKPVLVSEGVYADLCGGDGLGTDQILPCKNQVRISSQFISPRVFNHAGFYRIFASTLCLQSLQSSPMLAISSLCFDMKIDLRSLQILGCGPPNWLYSRSHWTTANKYFRWCSVRTGLFLLWSWHANTR